MQAGVHHGLLYCSTKCSARIKINIDSYCITGSSVYSALKKHCLAHLTCGVGAGDGSGVGTGEGTGVGCNVGTGVGISVGTGDGDGVGAGEGRGEGTPDGNGLGSGLGSGVGSVVGTGVGTDVGEGVGCKDKNEEEIYSDQTSQCSTRASS